MLSTPALHRQRLLTDAPRPARQSRCHSASTAQSAVSASPAPRVTFTNPQGNILESLRENVWIADRPFIWNTIDVGGRMTVVRISDGSLWVHSPVELDRDLAAALQQLGPVKHVVSPNFEHLKYAQQWIDAYPDATAYGCPWLLEAHPEISFDKTVGEDNSVPEGWPEEIEVTYLNHEVNPFNGKPFFNEVAFFHTLSRTLMTADFFWNYPAEGVPVRTRIWKAGMDSLFAPFYFNLMIKDQGAYNRSMVRMLGQDWDTLIPCHGDVVDTDAKAVLRRFARC
eukprot:jgi/Ulvmu1/9501/UM052_0072.1